MFDLPRKSSNAREFRQPLTVFETAAFDHSATSPDSLLWSTHDRSCARGPSTARLGQTFRNVPITDEKLCSNWQIFCLGWIIALIILLWPIHLSILRYEVPSNISEAPITSDSTLRCDDSRGTPLCPQELRSRCAKRMRRGTHILSLLTN